MNKRRISRLMDEFKWAAEPQPPLIEAIIKGDRKHVRMCIERGDSVNVVSTYGNTAVWYSINTGRPLVVEALLSAGAGADTTIDAWDALDHIMDVRNTMRTLDLDTGDIDAIVELMRKYKPVEFMEWWLGRPTGPGVGA